MVTDGGTILDFDKVVTFEPTFEEVREQVVWVFGQKGQPVQRPGARSMSGVFEGQQGAQWEEMKAGR